MNIPVKCEIHKKDCYACAECEFDRFQNSERRAAENFEMYELEKDGNKKLQESLADAKRDLEKYGKHINGCTPESWGFESDGKAYLTKKKCTCGYQEAISK